MMPVADCNGHVRTRRVSRQTAAAVIAELWKGRGVVVAIQGRISHVIVAVHVGAGATVVFGAYHDHRHDDREHCGDTSGSNDIAASAAAVLADVGEVSGGIRCAPYPAAFYAA